MYARGRWQVLFPAVAALALVLSAGGRANADLIVNGSFETPNVGGGFAFFPNGAVPGWTSNNNELEIDFTPILSPAGTPAFAGNQSAELDGNTFDTISQTVTGLTPGRTYLLSWAYGTRPGSGPQQMNVLFGGNLVAEDAILSSDPNAVIWTPQSVLVSATGTSEVLSFEAVNVGGNPSVGNELDAVSLVTVPEPSSLALLGLGGLAFAGWRRWKGRRRGTTAA